MEGQLPESQIQPPEQVAPIRKSRFLDTKALQTVDLGDGDWVKVPVKYPAGFIENMGESVVRDGRARVTAMATACIKEWNLVGPDGLVAEINLENIESLSLPDVEKIMKVVDANVDAQMKLPKAELPQSDEQ